MALTATQRYTVLQALLATNELEALKPIPSGIPLATLLPGVSAATLLSAIATALGAAFDTQGAIVLTNLTTLANQQLTAAQAQVTALQAQVAAL